MRILSIGQCGFDHGRISGTLQRALGAEVVDADSLDEALALLERSPADLILVNRKLDADGSDGLAIIRDLRTSPATSSIPVMLVSNYPEYQAQAVALGAAAGFGKADLDRPETLAKFAAALQS